VELVVGRVVSLAAGANCRMRSSLRPWWQRSTSGRGGTCRRTMCGGWWRSWRSRWERHSAVPSGLEAPGFSHRASVPCLPIFLHAAIHPHADGRIDRLRGSVPASQVEMQKSAENFRPRPPWASMNGCSGVHLPGLTPARAFGCRGGDDAGNARDQRYREYADVQEAVVGVGADRRGPGGRPGHHRGTSTAITGAEDNGLAVVDAVELKVRGRARSTPAWEAIPGRAVSLFRGPGGSGGGERTARESSSALAGHARRARRSARGASSRTPSQHPRHLAAFMVACQGRALPFKANGGLHHPVAGRVSADLRAGRPARDHARVLNVFCRRGDDPRARDRRAACAGDPGSREIPSGVKWKFFASALPSGSPSHAARRSVLADHRRGDKHV